MLHVVSVRFEQRLEAGMVADRVIMRVKNQRVDADRRMVRHDGFQVSECLVGESGLG